MKTAFFRKVSPAWGLAVAAIGYGAWRSWNLAYNTVHIDEALYASVGLRMRGGESPAYFSNWLSGSLFFPRISSALYAWAGLPAMRLLAVFCIAASGFLLSWSCLRLWGRFAAWWTLVLFLFSIGTMNLAVLAVHDPLWIFLLSLSIALAVLSAARERDLSRAGLVVLSGLIAALACMVKYAALSLIPGVLAFCFFLVFPKRRSGALTWSGAFALTFALFVAMNLGNLLAYAGLHGYMEATTARTLLGEALHGLNGLWLLIGVTAFVLARARNRTWLLHYGLITGLAALPLAYHFSAMTRRSMWRHLVGMLIVLVPTTVHFLMVGWSRLEPRRARVWAWAGLPLFLVAYVFYNASFLKNFDKSWATVGPDLAFLEKAPLDRGDLILAEPYWEYFLYSHWSLDQRIGVYRSIWYDEYLGAQWDRAVLLGIQHARYRYIALSGYVAGSQGPLGDSLMGEISPRYHPVFRFDNGPGGAAYRHETVVWERNQPELKGSGGGPRR